MLHKAFLDVAQFWHACFDIKTMPVRRLYPSEVFRRILIQTRSGDSLIWLPPQEGDKQI